MVVTARPGAPRRDIAPRQPGAGSCCSHGALALVLTTGAPAPAHAALDLRNVLNDNSLTSWGPTDGLPANEVLAIAQDPDGFLWLGTNGGLVRFDGTRFVLLSGPAVDRPVRALVITAARRALGRARRQRRRPAAPD